MSLFDESPAQQKRREVEARYRNEAVKAKELCAKIAQDRKFVATELVRNLAWAREQAAAMRQSLRQVQLENCERSPATYNHEREQNCERWLLRYVAIEVQALAGLAALSPEAIDRLGT
jgi:hypothetical protein